MKSRIALLGIFTLLSACGMGDRRGALTSESENHWVNLWMSNLKTHSFHQVQQLSSGSQYRYLGTFELEHFPASIAALPSESEIGTLSLELEDEIYSENYEGEVLPLLKKRTQEVKSKVYLIHEMSSPQWVTLAVKNDEFAKDIRSQETPITVHSNPIQFCQQVHIPFTVGNNANGLDQNATCDFYGNCEVMIQYTGAFRKGEIITLTQNIAKDKIEAFCTQHKTQYLVSESKQNRSIPRLAMVHLNAGILLHSQILEFDL